MIASRAMASSRRATAAVWLWLASCAGEASTTVAPPTPTSVAVLPASAAAEEERNVAAPPQFPVEAPPTRQTATSAAKPEATTFESPTAPADSPSPRARRPFPVAICVAARRDVDPSDAYGNWTWNSESGGPPQITGRLVDADGNAAPRIRLRFWASTGRGTADTDEYGAFKFVLDGDVDYDVDAIVEFRYREPVADVRVHVGTVHSGTHDVVLRLPIAPVVVATGTVTETSGAPLAGRHVSATFADADPKRRRFVASAKTDARGAFRIVSWIDRPVTASVSSSSDDDRIWEYRPDAASDAWRIVGRHFVEGTVVVRRTGDVPAAKITLWRDDGVLVASTSADAKGCFRFLDVDPAVRHVVGVEIAGYEPRERCPFETDVRGRTIDVTHPTERLDGRAFAADRAALGDRWIRFIAPDGVVACLTDDDGSFHSVNAYDAEFEAFLLVPAADGRLVPGPSLGRCRGGSRDVVLRAPR